MMTTMSRTRAIREAKAEVSMQAAGTMPGGYAGYRVSEYDHGYRAWVEGRPMFVYQARPAYKAAVVGKALALLGWESWKVDRALQDSWEWTGQSVEQVVRELVEV